MSLVVKEGEEEQVWRKRYGFIVRPKLFSLGGQRNIHMETANKENVKASLEPGKVRGRAIKSPLSPYRTARGDLEALVGHRKPLQVLSYKIM